MDYVLARISRQRKNLVKVLSDKSLFESIDYKNVDCVDYAPDHNLDEDSWYKIDNFSQQSYFPEFLKHQFDSKAFNEIERSQFKDIKLLISVQDKALYFQKVFQSIFMVKRSFLAFGEQATLKEDESLLAINKIPDAIYYIDEDVLIFQSLATLSSVFKGIDELYKEATAEEVENFLTKDFIDLKSDFSAEKVSKPNRKRIALAMQTFTSMSEDEQNDVVIYINEYCDDSLKYDDESKKFEISSDIELKNLLYGIEQRFYTTRIGGRKRLANSVMDLN